MRTSQKTLQTRANLRAIFGKIVDLSNSVHDEMKDVPYVNGAAHRSLNPQSGEYVVYSEGISAFYRHTDGKMYNIHINIVPEGK